MNHTMNPSLLIYSSEKEVGMYEMIPSVWFPTSHSNGYDQSIGASFGIEIFRGQSFSTPKKIQCIAKQENAGKYGINFGSFSEADLSNA
ncbi:hypothetical protein CEXT_592161 [Caerostris extrusa]|uniref:Uncharacterized protein n=1 Tax=Caerostris extrusa TaxID=172846 RepID=A0AAV4SPJ3_CAEEX|nr:hypothetical protein CEXT_592161 [Caerostris extrusa]